MATFSFEDAQDTGSFSFEDAQIPETFSFEDGLDGTARTIGGAIKDAALGNPLVRGFERLGYQIDTASGLIRGDEDAITQGILKSLQLSQKYPGSQARQELGKAWERGEGAIGGIKESLGEVGKDWNEAKGILGKVRALGENAMAMGSGVLEQTPNMIAPMTFGALGGAVGSAVGPAGAVGGGFGGFTVGNATVEAMGIAQEMLQDAGINMDDEEAVSSFVRENRGEILKRAGIKGAIIGGVDTLTAGAGHLLLTAPGKAAANRALKAMGTDLADNAAVKAAMESAEFAERIASDAVYQASKKGLGNIARNTTVAAMDPAGEFTGEYVGSGLATGKWDTKDATLEALSSIGQSGGMFALQKGAERITSPESTSHLPSEKILAAESVDQLIAEFEAESIGAEPEVAAQTTGALARAPEMYRVIYQEAGLRHGVDPNLLAAQGWAESGFNPNAVSPVGAQGIAQFMPGTAAEYGIDPMDPVQAIDGQARYMANMLERYDGDVARALAAYNAGPGRVDDGSWQNINETQNYVGRILGELGQEAGPMSAEWAAQTEAAQAYNQARNTAQLDESIQFADQQEAMVAELEQVPAQAQQVDAPVAQPQEAATEPAQQVDAPASQPQEVAPQQDTTEPTTAERSFVPDVPLVEPIATQIEEDVQSGQGSGSQIAKNESQPDLRSIDNPQPRFVPDVPLEQVKTVDNGDGSFSLVHKETGESILDGQTYGSKKEARAAFVQERNAARDLKPSIAPDRSAAQSRSASPGGQPASAREPVVESGQTTPNALPTSNANTLPIRNSGVNADIETELSDQLGSGRVGRLVSKGKVEILETQQDAEAIIRDLDTTPKRSKDGKIQGFTTPDGKAYLVRDGIAKGNAMGVLSHEMGVHAKRLGFKKDAEWQGVVDSIERRKNSKGRSGQAIRAAMERIPQNTAPEHMQEELVAYLVENHAGDKIPIVDRIIAHIKKWLYKAGIMNADRLSPKDLAVFARAAIREEAGTFDGNNTDIRYSRAAQAEAEEALDQDLQSVAEQVPKKFDIHAATPWVKTAEYTLSKIAAGRRALEAVSRRQERKFTLQSEILDGETKGMNAAERQVARDNGFVATFRRLKKDAPQSYAKVQRYLLGIDRTGRGFHLSHESGYVVTTPDGKLVGLAKTREEALTKARDHVRDNGLKGKVLIKDYGTDKGFIWTAHRPNKSKIGTFTNEQEAVAAMIKGEQAELRKRGFTEQEAAAVQSFREMTNRAFDQHAEGAREVLRRCEEEGIDPPMVESIDETRRYAVRDKNGKNIATFESREKAENMLRQLSATHPLYRNAQIVRQKDSEIKKRITLHDAIAQMGDLRGTYFPRQREHGGMNLRAINEQTGEKVLLKGDLYLARLDPEEKKGFLAQKSDALRKVFNSWTSLGRQARKLRKQGFVISFERDTTMPEDVFSEKQLATNIAALMDEGMQRVDKSSMTPAEVDAYVSMHRAVTEQLAGIIKQRGFLSSRMKRAENYWEGFETDPLKAGTSYASGLAGGIAKRQLAQDLTMIITGRDISWKQWQEENPEGTWPEYIEFVNDRKIDPVAQKNLYGETMSWATEILRNQETADRIIGTLKGLAVFKYLAFRIPSAAVNLTNMGLGVPATIASHTGLSLTRTTAQINRSLKTLVDYKRGKASELDVQILTEISERGWDNPQFNHDAAAVMRTKFGNAWQDVVDAGMWLFATAEVVNRRATIHAAYKMWQRANPDLTHEELMQKAHHASDRAHGWYGKATEPRWTRGAANPLKMVWTFQKFAQNYMLNIGEMIGKGDYKNAAYMLLAPVVLGGPKATLATPLLIALANGLGIGGEDPEEELYAWARGTFGTDSWMRFGAPGLLGISFQGSLAMGIPVVSDMNLFRKDTAIKTVAEIFGAPGSVVYDTYAAGKHALKGEYLKATEKVLPSGLGSAAKAIRESTEGVTTESYGSVYYGADPLKVSGVESYLRALSFSTADIAGKRQQQWSERKIKDKYAEKRADINREIKRIFLQNGNTLPPEEFAKILPKIDRYNDAVAGLNRPDISSITGKSIRAMLKRSSRPSKLERYRAMEMYEAEWDDE